jgi:signal transduction histidine kinase
LLTEGLSAHARDVDTIRAGRETSALHRSPRRAVGSQFPTRSTKSMTAPMPPILYSRELRTERLIAGARVVLMAFSLVAAWLHPVAPAEHGLLVYSLLAAYAVYSTGLLILLRDAPAPLPYPIARHVVDVIVISAWLYLSLGVSSPFFPCFAFLLVATSLRWHWRGTLWTGAAMLAAVTVAGLCAALWWPDEFHENGFIVGVVSLVLTAVLLAKLGASEERGRRDVQELPAEPELAADDRDALIRQLPLWVAHVLGAQRALIAWEEPEEPRLCLASFGAEESRYSQIAPGIAEPMVPHELSGADFLCRRMGDAPQLVIYRSSGGFKRWHGSPLHPVLQALFAATSVLSVRLESETVRGRIFWFDKAGLNSDDILLGEIVARQVSSRLDRFYLLRQLAEQAVDAERARMGRDLHDGALHALAGVALELESVVRQRDLEFVDCQDRLRQIQRTLEMEQCALRMVIERLRSSGPAQRPNVCLSVRVKDLVERIERQRGLRVEWTGATTLDGLANEQAGDVYLLLHESLTNAARHSGAGVLRMAAGLRDGWLEISVADDGRGFPFKGRYDLPALTALDLGPATLKERVTRLGGGLTIDSTEHGSRLQIFLPAPDSMP